MRLPLLSASLPDPFERRRSLLGSGAGIAQPRRLVVEFCQLLPSLVELDRFLVEDRPVVVRVEYGSRARPRKGLGTERRFDDELKEGAGRNEHSLVFRQVSMCSRLPRRTTWSGLRGAPKHHRYLTNQRVNVV